MRLLLHCLVFFIMAGLAHIAGVFALPHLSRENAFTRLAADAPANTIALVDTTRARGLPFADPATALAICRYSLAEGPVRVRVPLSETFLSVTVAEMTRGIFASVSDRAATGGSLDIVLATPSQLARIAALDEEDQAIEEIRLASAGREGLAILKVIVDRPSSRERAENVLRQAHCASEKLPD